MAQILDTQGLQHYANKMCNADNRKVGTKRLPTVLNELDIAINGFKNAFEIEYGSPVNMEIVNNQNIFTVGTGNNVDKKDDVENSFTDLKISGNSLVNLNVNKGASLFGTSGDGAGYSRSYNEDSTICTYKTVTKPVISYVTLRINVKEKLKKNTKYTLMFNIFENNIPNLQKGISVRGASDPYHHPADNPSYYHLFYDANFNNSPGQKKIVFTTGDNINQYTGFGFGFPANIANCTANLIFKIGNVVLLEGDYTNKTIPEYFEGLKSVGEQKNNNHTINIWSENKNLWKLDRIRTQDGAIPLCTRNHNEIVYTSVGEFGIYSPIQVKAGQTLKISGIVENVQNIRLFKQSDKFQGGGVYNKDFNGIKTEVSPNYSYTFTEDGKYHIRVWCKSTGQAKLVNFLAEISNNNTEYDKYRSDNKILSLKQPLRGLPNGVKDTIEKVDGEWKIVRRCAKETLNGQELGWAKHPDLSGTNVFFFYINTKSSTSLSTGATKSDSSIRYIQSDSIACYAMINRLNNRDNSIEGIYYSDSLNPLIQIHINKSKLTSHDVDGFKTWLSQNPVTVLYELETYIIEDIDPITLQCWKNGTISIADEAIPVETTHTVALNKSAQIQNNIEELTSLRNRVKTLEEQYSKTALNQAYETELLKLDMKLDDII